MISKIPKNKISVFDTSEIGIIIILNRIKYIDKGAPQLAIHSIKNNIANNGIT